MCFCTVWLVSHLVVHSHTCTYTQDGTLEEGKVTELSQMYAERFNMEPTQIMGTIKDICKGPEIKVYILMLALDVCPEFME